MQQIDEKTEWVFGEYKIIADEDCLESGLSNPVRFTLMCNYYPGEVLGEFMFSPMPGNSNIVISTQVIIHPKWRNTGLGTRFFLWRLHVASELGYARMYATIRMDNIPELAIVLKNGGRILETFANERLGNLIGFVSVILK